MLVSRFERQRPIITVRRIRLIRGVILTRERYDDDDDNDDDDNDDDDNDEK